MPNRYDSTATPAKGFPRIRSCRVPFVKNSSKSYSLLRSWDISEEIAARDGKSSGGPSTSDLRRPASCRTLHHCLRRIHRRHPQSSVVLRWDCNLEKHVRPVRHGYRFITYHRGCRIHHPPLGRSASPNFGVLGTKLTVPSTSTVPASTATRRLVPTATTAETTAAAATSGAPFRGLVDADGSAVKSVIA